MDDVMEGAGGIDVAALATDILNFLFLVGISPVFWLTVAGPTMFHVAMTALRSGAFERRRDNPAPDVHPALRLATEIKPGQPAYVLLDFTIQYFTLFASLIGINLAIWRMVLIPSGLGNHDGWTVLHPSVLILKGVVVTAITLTLLVTGFFGRPRVIESYARSPDDTKNFLRLTLPPRNRITLFRSLCAISAAYLVYLAYYGLGVRIL